MITEMVLDMVQSPIRPANGWTAAPEEAKEMTILFSGGFISRPCLILKNEKGKYDRAAMNKNKKAIESIVVMTPEKMVIKVVDEGIRDDKRYKTNRNIKILNMDPSGWTILIMSDHGQVFQAHDMPY